jgi:hypothetical protein
LDSFVGFYWTPEECNDRTLTTIKQCKKTNFDTAQEFVKKTFCKNILFGLSVFELEKYALG